MEQSSRLNVFGTHFLWIEHYNIQKMIHGLFWTYQASALHTAKLHILNHLLYDINWTGDVSYMTADLYENTHKRFNDDYEKTSKRYTLQRVKLHNARKERRRCFSGEYLLKIRIDSRPKCFGKRANSRKKEEPEYFDGSMLNESWLRTTVGMIANVKQTLNCIPGHIWSPDCEELWTGCQLKQIGKLLKEPELSIISKNFKRRSYLSWHPRRHIITYSYTTAYLRLYIRKSNSSTMLKSFQYR